MAPPPNSKEELSDKTSTFRVTDSVIKLPKWLLIVLVVGAFTVGGAWAALLDARERVSRLEVKQAVHEIAEGHPLLRQRVQTLENSLSDTKKKQDENSKMLQQLQSDMRAVCTAVNANCPRP